MDSPASDPLRILHVFRAPLGGLFRHVIDLARGQIARGHQVGILCDSTTGGARTDAVLAELSGELALGVTRLPMPRLPGWADVQAQRRVNACRRRLKPDIVHAHGSKGGVYGRLPALLWPARTYATAYTPHGGSFNYRPGSSEHRIYMTVERLLERATDMFLFESAYIADRFETHVGHMPRTDHRIVLNGVSAAEFEPIDHGGATFDLVYLGELRQAKGIDTLIEALARMDALAGLQPRLLIVGSGPDEAKLKQLTVESGVAERCVFAAPGPIRHALSQARVMVVPSRAESLPYVVLEAAAAAQPLVATNVGGIREIYGPDHAPRLIMPDDPAVLAAAIAEILSLSDAERLAQAKDLAAHVARNFCIEAMIDNVLDAYRAAITSRRGAGRTLKPA